MSKGKGTNSTRSRNARKTEKEDEPSIDSDQVLDDDFRIQRATQMVTETYEKRMLAQENGHRKEMENFMEGQKFWVKPSLWARITGRYKDMYMIYNHLRPHHCTACGTNHQGVNFGIEALTLDLDTALSYIDEMMDKYPGTKARLLHLQVDRRSRRTGQIVNDFTFLLADWDRERRKYITDEITAKSASNKVFASLAEDTRGYREGKRRRRNEMP